MKRTAVCRGKEERISDLENCQKVFHNSPFFLYSQRYDDKESIYFSMSKAFRSRLLVSKTRFWRLSCCLAVCKQSIGTITCSVYVEHIKLIRGTFFLLMPVINDFEIVNVLKLITRYFLWPTLWLSKAGPLLHAFVY